MAQAIEQIGGVLAIEQRERRVQADLGRVQAQQAVRDRVERPRPRQRSVAAAGPARAAAAARAGSSPAPRAARTSAAGSAAGRRRARSAPPPGAPASASCRCPRPRRSAAADRQRRRRAAGRGSAWPDRIDRIDGMTGVDRRCGLHRTSLYECSGIANLRFGADVQGGQQDVPAVRAGDDVVGLRPAPDGRLVSAQHHPVDRRGRAARAEREGGEALDRPSACSPRLRTPPWRRRRSPSPRPCVTNDCSVPSSRAVVEGKW